MAQKRVSSSNSKKTTPKKTSKRRKSKKTNEKIPTYKVLVYCALAVAICILLYLIADISGKTVKNESSSNSIVERYEKIDENDSKNEIKTPVQKVETEKKNQSTEKAKEKSSQDKNINSSEKKSSQNVQKNQNVEKPKTKQENIKKSEEAKKNPIKKEEKQNSQKKDYDFPNAKNNAKIAFVFDDGGQNLSQLEKFINLPFPITIAVLPKLPHSVDSAKKIRASGNELILHQPMQSVNANVNPGFGAITPEMTENQIISVLFENVNEIAPIAGFNNHEGSAITADAEKMATVLKFASEEGIYFLDSRTNVETKVPYVAEQMGYSYYERNIFLDNEKTRENVVKELKKGLNIANRDGQVIMIGHIWSADFLPELLKEIYPELTKKGYKFIKVSQAERKN